MNAESGTSVERYELLGELATGGMATVYFGRQRGPLGFSRTVAIKSMHPQLAKDPAFRAMFVDEAHLTARIRHPNVVPTLDIVQSATKLLIVMEYVEGVSLSVLLKSAQERKVKIPVAVIAAIGRDLLEGLHAAHELRDDRGQPLGVVHRDVSPQNILVGVDGIARVVDFGVAKATGRSYQTQTGEIRGKVGYMAPEQMFGEAIDRRVDLYASGVVLWECLAGDRLYNAPTDAALVLLVTRGMVSPPSVARGERLPDGLDALVSRALSQEPGGRFSTAREMLNQLLAVTRPASLEEVGRVVRELAAEEIALRSAFLRNSSASLEHGGLESEAKAVLEVLAQATTTRDAMALSPGAPVSILGSASGAHGPQGSRPGERAFVPLRLPILAVAALLSTIFLVFAVVHSSRKPPAGAGLVEPLVPPQLPATAATAPLRIAPVPPPPPPPPPEETAVIAPAPPTAPATTRRPIRTKR